MTHSETFNDIRIMNKYQLRTFVKNNRSIQQIFLSRSRYTESQRILSSKVIYAKNRLRLMS